MPLANTMTRLLLPLVALVLGFAAARLSATAPGMAVTFHNASTTPIESIQLDFGSADTQSSILALRLVPDASRTLLLNHTPGLGFNVQVRYGDGRRQSFCALRGDKRQRVTLDLAP